MLPEVARKQSPRCECTTYCPDPTLPRPDSLFPATTTPLPPLIHHISVKGKNWLRLEEGRLDRDDEPELNPENQASSIVDTITNETGITPSYVEELVHFGAVYIGTVLRGREAEQILKSKEERAFRQKSARETQKGTSYPVSKVTRLTVSESRNPANIGTYLRVHVNPRRYVLSYRDDWKSRIVQKTDDFVVVNKPAGIPSVPTIDNLEENSMRQVQLALNLERPLHAISRLDVCTSGLIIYACNPKSASAFGKMLISKSISKQYRLLATGQVPEGRLRHLCRKRNFDAVPKPRIYRNYEDDWSPTSDPDWQMAELIVQRCSRVGRRSMYECDVTLLTGRTHQVRLQMAAIGATLLGDTKCFPVHGRTHQGRDVDDSVDIFGPEPNAVALQCSSLSFSWKDEQHVYHAGDPWWREDGALDSAPKARKLTLGQNLSLTSSQL